MQIAKRVAPGLDSFLSESLALSFLWQMNRHVQSAVLTLIHTDAQTSSAQTPYGQGRDAESLCAVMCVCVFLCENIRCRCVVCLCTASMPGCCCGVEIAFTIDHTTHLNTLNIVYMGSKFLLFTFFFLVVTNLKGL